MNLGRQAISATVPTQIIDVRFDADCDIFACSTPSGFAVYRSFPLNLLRKREITGGTLSTVLPLHSTSLLFLVGGGRSPRYPPNKVIFWDDAQGKEVAELEFRDAVKGIACRRGMLVVALKRRVVAFEITQTVKRIGEWETAWNDRGLVALATAPGATVMAIPGPQTGYIHLVHLPPCPAPPEDFTPGTRPGHPTARVTPLPARRDPVALIQAHTSALTTISLSPSGRYLATTSENGTLIRIWDTTKGANGKGHKSHEFRRGMDQAHMYGVAFRPDERECCAWSDKGTVHVFSLERSNRLSALRQATSFLPGGIGKIIDSEWSYAQYRLPTPSAHQAHSMSQTNRLGTAHPDAGDEERWMVGWITLPSDTTPQSSPAKGPVPLPSIHNKGKGRMQPLGSPLRGPGDRPSPLSPSRSSRAGVTSPSLPDYQLVALTFTGGWYRLSLPNQSEPTDRSSTPEPYQGSGGAKRSAPRQPESIAPSERTGSGSPQLATKRLADQKRRDSSRRRGSDAQVNDTNQCHLEEFRRYGRWDGWG
ncbi:hypothetical protein M408DRAFT_331305 [Serendipita vermifera MAFF 305830]|uniref:DUF2415 domain-containing protein n=1 Tax=Serendipita vermifera MAFF 305830 TaxID=933852 RepID=A0A0C2X7G9_SERVB|nr:hypothetical protein M408DRAFT_331305 [Serendipita vermifera MAFF 305830]